MIHEVTIPEDLITWGKQPAVRKTLARPWAHLAEELIEQAPLDVRQTTALYARLEALCRAAVDAGRQDLVLGLDTYSAARLGLTVTLQQGEKRLSVGPRGDWSWSELETVLEAPGADPSAQEAVDRCKGLMGEVFPSARVDAIVDHGAYPKVGCASCGDTEATVMFEMQSGSEYCRKCWSFMTTPWPRIEQRGSKVVVIKAGEE